tara:strand:- start:4043 stop:4942 length:900 start_codon:yes stop_codon:yes gene_type:complete
MVVIQKPFLKWVGGKTQLLKAIIPKIPDDMENYHEIFLGGGSVLFAVLSLKKQNKITIRGKLYAYDINYALIQVYNDIKYNKDKLYSYIDKYINEYNSIEGDNVNRNPETIEDAITSKESYYYWLRKRYNTLDKKSIERSALFMIINKTCFRGMYREGPNGYNVPYGHYKKTPTIIIKNELDTISELIQDVEFIHSDFTNSIQKVSDGDFVYLDPPYAPETSTSFVGYVAGGFTIEQHESLFTSIKSNDNIKFLMSNAKVELVIKHFDDKKYSIEEILARRAINSKNPGSTTTEVMIYN